MDYKKIHEHIMQEHDLFLFDDEIKEIVRIVLEITDNKLDIKDDYPLFDHMDEEHGVTLLESQLGDIIRIVLEMHNENPETCTEAIKEPSNNDQMKTAMQELIEELKKRRSLIKEAYKPLNHLVDANSLVDIMIRQINHDIELAESLLEKEKQQLEKAWQDGAKTAQNDAAKEIRNNYTPNKL